MGAKKTPMNGAVKTRWARVELVLSAAGIAGTTGVATVAAYTSVLSTLVYILVKLGNPYNTANHEAIVAWSFLNNGRFLGSALLISVCIFIGPGSEAD